MNNLKIFENEEFGRVRTMMIEGEIYFVGKDVAEALGYTNTRNAVPNNVDKEDRLRTVTEYAGQRREITVINESGLYSLILRSKLPNAKKFKRWVTSEVLPCIRKTGAYITDDVIDEITKDPILMRKLIEKVVAEKDDIRERERKLRLQLEEQQPLVAFANHVTNSKDCIDIGDFSKILADENIKIGRNRLFDWLRKNKFLKQDNVPYQDYINREYFKVIEVTKETSYGPKVFPKTLVTGKGQVYFTEKLRAEMILKK